MLSDFPKKWRVPIIVFFIICGIFFLYIGFSIGELIEKIKSILLQLK